MTNLSGLLLTAAVIGLIFVNGFTDAPNAITGVVVTGGMRFGSAVRMAAVCNLAGIAVMGLLSPSVTDTMLALADLSGCAPRRAVSALCAAMLGVVLFAVAAWWFGIPTSESHALIAALTGASLALGGIAGVSAQAWGKVLLGLVFSLTAGLLAGYALSRRLAAALGRLSPAVLRAAQLAAAAAMAFLHGAQDGLKFVAVLVLAERLAGGTLVSQPVELRAHLPALALCAAAMTLGTGMGGRRIILRMGAEMTALNRPRALCADLAGAICLLCASLAGVPVSTTHTKTAAVMGAGLAGGSGGLDRRVAREVLLAWAITFPVCGLLGYALTKLLAA